MRQPASHKPAAARRSSRLLAIDGERDWRLMERLRSIVSGAVEALHLEDAVLLLREPHDELFQGRIAARAGQKPTVLVVAPVSPEAVLQAVRDAASDPLGAQRYRLGDYTADLAAPVEIDGQIEGVLAARGTQARDDPWVRRSLEIFAAQASYAVEAAQADARHEIEALHQETLFEVARTVSSALDSSEILKMVAELMAAGVNSPRVCVYLWEPGNARLLRKATFGLPGRPGRESSSIRYSPEHPYVQALERSEPVHLEPDDDDAFGARLKASVHARRAVAIPLVSKGSAVALAVIALAGRGPGEGGIDLLKAVAGQAALAIENARLYEAQNQAATELAGLYAVSHSLAAAPDLEGRLAVVAESIATVLGVSRCAVFLIESGYLRGHLMTGGSERESAELRELRLGLSERETAMMAAIKNGYPTLVERGASRRDAYVAARWRVKRMAVVPLINQGRTIGLAAADEPGRLARFSERALRMAGAIGEHAALAVHNARLFEQTRQHAEDLLVLWELGEELGAQTDEREIVRTLLRHIRRLPMAQYVSLTLRTAAGSLEVFTDEGIQQRYESEDKVVDPCDLVHLETMKSQQPKLWRNVPRHDRPHLQHKHSSPPACVYRRAGWEQLSSISMLGVPIVEELTSIGAICLISPGDREFSPAETQLVGSISSIAGSALRRARLYERERRVAETLQRSFLPDIPDSLGPFEVSDRYAAALHEARVGGDFYDVFDLGNGRVGLVMGDVSGKGLGAAIHTATAKYTIRAYAYKDADPANVLAGVNDALCFFASSTLFITLFYGHLDLSTGTLVYANAGHEPPLHFVSSSGGFSSLAVTGRAIGFLPGAQYINERADIAAGDSLILFTDGITEARGENGFFDPAGVRAAALPHVAAPAATIADQIESRLQEHTGGAFRDDYALIVLKRSW